MFLWGKVLLPARVRQLFIPTIAPIRWIILHQILRTIRATLAVRLKVRSDKLRVPRLFEPQRLVWWRIVCRTWHRIAGGTSKPLVPKCAVGLILDNTRLDGKGISGGTYASPQDYKRGSVKRTGL
jgi:hypothetical protein